MAAPASHAQRFAKQNNCHWLADWLTQTSVVLLLACQSWTAWPLPDQHTPTDEAVWSPCPIQTALACFAVQRPTVAAELAKLSSIISGLLWLVACPCPPELAAMTVPLTMVLRRVRSKACVSIAVPTAEHQCSELWACPADLQLRNPCWDYCEAGLVAAGPACSA